MIFILSGSTKYYEPLSCGVRSCDFGATCIKGDCLCEFDCQNGDSYYKEPVCGNDGNTYRTECQLRQYSCRIQKEIIIVKYEPCTDAPRAVYGLDSRQSHYREVPRWEIFMEQELRFGLDLGQMANFPAFIASKYFDL